MNNKLSILVAVFLIASLTSGFGPVYIESYVAKGSSPTIITSLPYSITEPGVYILGGNLTASNDGITVLADDVVIIGGGYAIKGSGIGSGILVGEFYNSSGGYWASPDNVTIMDLVIEDFEYGINATSLWTDDYSFVGLVIDGVSIYGCDEGIHLDYIVEPGGVVINNTFISDSFYYGVYAYEVTDLYILNTIINGSDGFNDDYGVYLDSSEAVYIFNSTIRNTYYEGIYAYDYYDYGYNVLTVVKSNIVDTWDDGIEVYYAYGVLILYSNISGNYYNGVNVRNSEYVWIYQDIIDSNDEYGVYIQTYSENVYVNSSVVSNNGLGGIYLDDTASDVYIWRSQINYNDGYGVEAYTTYPFNVEWNTFGENTESPQAFDDTGSGDWNSNYWSDLTGTTYSFDNNIDSSPLSDPLPFIYIEGVTAPTNATQGDIVNVEVTVTNLGYGAATGFPITLYWSEPLGFSQANYIWLPVDLSTASNASDGDVITDYGNYTLWDEDDGYLVYKLPWPIEVYGESYTYISVSTNGLVELLTQPYPVVGDDYEVHWIGEHRTGSDYYSNYTYGAGVTAIFSYDGDLRANYWVGIFNTGNEIIIYYNGTTYGDDDPVNAPIQYQVILTPIGQITITLGNTTYQDLNGDAYTGLYIQPLALELPIGFHTPPFTSWNISTKLHPATSTNTTILPGETQTITLEWDTSTLPHLSPFTLWIGGTPTIWPASPTPGPTINVRPPPPGPTVVGGELTDLTAIPPAIIYTVILISISIITIILIKRETI